MRLKKLTIQNINSLFGTWEINFADSAYCDNSIFAIVGKNGSGKSTILDAISLALYDKTARLKDAKKSESVAFASYGTKESMASLIFELNGIEYTSQMTVLANSKTGEFHRTPEKNATWIQWYDAENVLHKIEGTESKRKTVQEILGLKFEQFCQVILLAQGKFNAFLTASPEERAEILEKITNTGIYAKVGAVVNEKKREAKNDLVGARQKLEGIAETFLSEEEVSAQEARLEKICEEKKACERILKKQDDLLKASEQIARCMAQLREKTAEGEKLQKEEEDFEKNHRLRLENARKAAAVTPVFEAFKALDDVQKRQKSQREKLQEDVIPEKERAELNCRYFDDGAGEVLRNVEKEQLSRENFLKSAEDLDREIASLAKQIDAGEKRLKSLDSSKKELATRVQEISSAISNLDSQKSKAEEYLNAHLQDATLEAKHSAWEVTRKALCAKKQELEAGGKSLGELAQKVLDAQKKQSEAKDDFARKGKESKQAKESLDDASCALTTALAGKTLVELEQDYSEQKKTVLLLQALKPQELLATFAEGEACPVCGAVHHPYRGLPKESFPDLERAQEKEKEYQEKWHAAKKAKDALEQARTVLTKAESNQKIAETAFLSASSSYDELTQQQKTAGDQLQEKRDEYSQEVGALQAELSSMGFVWSGEGDLPKEIQQRLDEYKKQSDTVKGFEAKRQELFAQKSCKEGEQTGKSAEYDHEEAALKCLKDDLAQRQKERKSNFGDLADISLERKMLAEKVSLARKKKTQAESAYSSAKTALDLARRESDDLADQMETREEDLVDRRQALEKALVEKGLDLQGYQSNVLPSLELNDLSAKASSLKERRNALDHAVKQLEESRNVEQAKLPEGFDEAKTREDQKEEKSVQEKLLAEEGGIHEKLKQNRSNQDQWKTLKKEIKTKEEIAERWERLDSWIGGKNFRDRAQRYTFAVLTAKANEQIKTMLGGRYSLCPSRIGDDMSIQVYDELLGGDMRSSANLSGGEQFVVSMALALGLSEMVGQKFHVDSLFLDEGFGTLDNDELENAMVALSSLTSRGKLVGVISHVEHLQNAISTKIRLVKKGNGRSLLEGPGIQKLKDAEMYVSKEEKKALAEAEKIAKANAKAAARAAKAAAKTMKSAK